MSLVQAHLFQTIAPPFGHCHLFTFYSSRSDNKCQVGGGTMEMRTSAYPTAPAGKGLRLGQLGVTAGSHSRESHPAATFNRNWSASECGPP